MIDRPRIAPRADLRPVSGRCRRAFTLVELLIVIGIIGVLIALVLSGVSKARIQAQRVACMSNLRQIGMALVAYATDNDGYFPAPAGTNSIAAYPEDWVHWQPGRDLRQSRIARYLNGDMRVLKCPGGFEERNTFTTLGKALAYPFSYSVNNRFTGSTAGGVFGVNWSPGPCKLGQCADPSMKILAIEEDTTGINDGEWWSGSEMDTATARSTSVSVIHDFGHEHSFGDISDRDRHRGRGLVVFADGRCDMFPRDRMLFSAYFDPRQQGGPY